MLGSTPSAVGQRAIAAIFGAAVADAAAAPLHWIYDQDKLTSIVSDAGRNLTPEFFEPWSNYYYVLEVGEASGYADQAYMLLQSLVAKKGLDLEDLGQRTKDFFTGPKYATGLGRAPSKEELPLRGKGWTHGSIRGFITNWDQGKRYPHCGINDAQIDCAVKMPPIVALYGGTEELLDRVEQVIRITQNSEEAVGYGMATARILEKVILGTHTVSEAVQDCLKTLRDPQRRHPNDIDADVATKLQQAWDLRDTPHKEVAALLGPSCALPNSVQNTVHMLSTATDYAQAVRTTIMAGGCNASRSSVIGACMAAQNGADTIPSEWIPKSKNGAHILELAKELATLRRDTDDKHRL